MNHSAEDHRADGGTAMDGLARSFIGSICESSQSAFRMGEDLLADWLGYDASDADSRQQMRRTTVVGAAGLFGLGFLFGTRTGRSVVYDLAILGGAAMLGKAAVDAGAAVIGHQGQAGPRKVSLLAVVIAAATPGRDVTQEEMHRIDARLDAMPEAQRAALLARTIGQIPDAEGLAGLVEEPLIRREVYAVSALLCAVGSPDAQDYLARLARALDLDEAEARALRDAAGPR